MLHKHSVLSSTVTAKGLWEAHDLIGWADTKIAADDAPVQGVAMHPATETGLAIAVMLVGWARVKASGAITKGMRVMSAAGGGVKDGTSGTNAFAVAMTTAADGEFVDILIR